MERVSQAQLSNALTAPEQSSPKSLSIVDSSILIELMERLTRRYPAQDQEGSIQEYFLDYERLALKYSLRSVAQALEELRIDSHQGFFPRPDEIAAVIESNIRAETAQRERESQARRRAEEILQFWATAPDWMEITGYTEEELLTRFPSYRGTKA